MRKLGMLVVVMSVGAMSVAHAQDAKDKKAAPAAPAAKPAAAPAAAPAAPAAPAAKPAEGAKMMRAPEPAPVPPKADAPAMPMAPPKPGPEQAAIAPLAQSWRCEGTAKDPAGGADIAYKSTWKGKLDLNKLWIAVEYKQNLKSKPPMVFTGKGFLGWNASGKNYLFSGADDWGGYLSLTSTGWDAAGANLVFSGDSGGPMGKMPFRMTFLKGASDKELFIKMEVQMGKDWLQVQAETCKR